MKNIEFLKEIMPEVEENVLKNETPYIIESGYESFRDIITLYAKQHNMVESTLLLMESNHNEEALILARSVLNNYFLIGYLINDPDKSHLKTYHLQPLLSNLHYWKNVKKILMGQFVKDLNQRGKTLAFSEADVEMHITELEEKIINAGYKKKERILPISELVKYADNRGLELYTTYYSEASKYEHSDITSLNLYKQSLLHDYSNNQVFVLNMNQTDENLNKKVTELITLAYTQSLYKITCEIIKLPDFSSSYDEQLILSLMRKLYSFINSANANM